MFANGKIRTVVAVSAMIGIGGANTAALLAQQTASDPIPAQHSRFEKDLIDAFAAARLRMEEIRSFYMPEFRAAKTDDDRRSITRLAAQEMIEAVEARSDITLEEFNSIAQAAADDPLLSQRIDKAMRTAP